MRLTRFILPAALAALSTSALGVSADQRVAQARLEQPQRVATALTQLLQHRESLGLDQRHSFTLKVADTDTLGQTHARFEQTFLGVKVWAGMVIAHTDLDGRALEATNAVFKNIELNVQPALSPAAAVNAALTALAPKGKPSRPPTAELVIYPQTVSVPRSPTKPRAQLNAVDLEQRVVRHLLAFHVHTEFENHLDGVAHTDFMVDANTGAVITRWQSLQTTRAVGTGNSQYSGTVSLEANNVGGGVFELRDTTRGSNGGNYTADQAQGVGGATIYSDADNQWGDGQNFVKTNPTTGANGQTAAVDAHFGLMKTWDYYSFVHGRNGIDGLGTQTFNQVHAADPSDPSNINYDNAFWSDSCFCMTFGDGSSTVDPATGFNTLTEIDIAGHEMSHGVTSTTAGLIYSGESGGLNEANSDIHGTMVEFYQRGGSGSTIGDTGGNYTVGEQTGPMPLRWMYKPSKDGSSVDAWSADLVKLDPHFSSGPMNRAFYFLARGALTSGDTATPYLPNGMTGIGNDKSARIWYRALTAYMTPGSTYVTARTAAIRSAQDLYGAKSVEVDAVKNAFAGINVGYTAGTFDDVIPPAISMLVDNQPTQITFTAVATDNLGVATVELYVDNLLLTTLTHAPFVFALNPLQLPSGSHVVTGIAYDVAGNSTTSDTKTFSTVGLNQIMVNGGFEATPDTGACRDANNNVDTCAPGWKTTLDVVNYGSGAEHSGNGVAWLNGYGTAHSDFIDQAIAMPATFDHATFSFYGAFSGTEATAGGDTANLKVLNSSGTVLATLATWSFPADYTSGYVQRNFDLTPYKGQSIHVVLTATENGSRSTNVQVDDFAINVSLTADALTPVVNGALVTVGAGSKMVAEVLDDGRIANLDFYVDGATTPTVSVTNGSFQAALPPAFTTPGPHSFIVKATDGAGHVGVSDPVPFSFDNVTNRIVNGGFESASVSPWVLTPSTTGQGCNTIGANTPNSGAKNALLGGCTTPSTATLTQDVLLPANLTYASFSFWLRILNGWTDGAQHDSLLVQIRDTNGTVLKTVGTYSNLDDTSGNYVHVLLPDLTAYKGTTVRVTLVSTQDSGTSGTQYSRFRVDDFSLNTSALVDTSPPSVTASLSGEYGTLGLQATITDGRDAPRAEFLIDGSLKATVTCCGANGFVHPTYDSTFNSALLTNGLHTYQVRGVDLAGNIGLSPVISFLVKNDFDATPPIVTVIGTSTYEKAVFSATALDNVAVVGVDFYVDDRLVGTSTGAPWVVQADWVTLGGSTHSVSARAYDAVGNTGFSSPITITRPTVSVVVSPASVGLLPGAVASFTAAVSGATSNAVVWAAPEGGTISAGGAFTAPASIGDYHATATSSVDPTRSGAALIRVYTGDENGDIDVDGLDMGAFSVAFGTSVGDAAYDAHTDLDANGHVDDADLTLFLAQFGR